MVQTKGNNSRIKAVTNVYPSSVRISTNCCKKRYTVQEFYGNSDTLTMTE